MTLIKPLSFFNNTNNLTKFTLLALVSAASIIPAHAIDSEPQPMIPTEIDSIEALAQQATSPSVDATNSASSPPASSASQTTIEPTSSIKALSDTTQVETTEPSEPVTPSNRADTSKPTPQPAQPKKPKTTEQKPSKQDKGYQVPVYKYGMEGLSDFAKEVNAAVWSQGMRITPATTVKLQALLDWNHTPPGPIDGGWGNNSKKALKAFERLHDLPIDGRMDETVWQKLTTGDLLIQPVLVQYTITEEDAKTRFASTPRGAQAKSKMRRLYYQNMQEMLSERFHMHTNFFRQLNKHVPLKAGSVITVFNTGKPLNQTVDKLIADKRTEQLLAYHQDKLVAVYPTTVGASNSPSPTGKHRVVNKVLMPWYKSTNKSTNQVHMLPPGPNNPVGVVWMGLSKPSFGIHGSPYPEGISRQASAGCVRLTNWNALDLYANLKKGATVEFK